jgi:hypothetical protein
VATHGFQFGLPHRRYVHGQCDRLLGLVPAAATSSRAATLWGMAMAYNAATSLARWKAFRPTPEGLMIWMAW